MRPTGHLLLAVVLVVGIASVIAPGKGLADVNSFVINDFSADETLSRQTPHGHLDITEQISVTYTDQNHGLLRALPTRYQGRSLQLNVLGVSSPSGAPAQYTTYDSNGNTVLKIGSPARTVTGPQAYRIHYSYDNVLTYYPDHDELYFDVNGDQWQQSIQHATVVLHVPFDEHIQAGPRCFAGSYRQSDGACTAAVTADGGLKAEASNLGPYHTLTFVAGLPTGYFKPYSAVDKAWQYLLGAAKLLFLPLASLAIAYPTWRKNGRDAAGKGVIVAQYEPYKGLKPIEIGTIMDFHVDNRDITATIIYLAVHKYLKIIERRKDNPAGKDSLTYSLELTNSDTAQLATFEAAVLTALFPQLVIGEQADLAGSARAGRALSALASKLRSSVSKELTSAGYFKRNPESSSPGLIGMIFVFVIATTLGYLIAGFSCLVGGLVAIAIVSLFASKMPARTAQGVKAYEHSQGLKLFLTITEAERYKKLVSPNADYAQANEPVKTVELFEKLLPYAVALGVETGWAAQCNDLYTQAPDWYGGDFDSYSPYNSFTTLYLTRNLSASLSSQLNSSYTAPSSSSSSGFGSGGFSGGGGGGGGGGGW